MEYGVAKSGYWISIHAPHEGERRKPLWTFTRPRADFNPRSPRGGATNRRAYSGIKGVISIHAPHEGERQMPCLTLTGQVGFQSTLPTRGSDTRTEFSHTVDRLFQSTLPTRGSDLRSIKTIKSTDKISIHAPHEGERPSFCGLLRGQGLISIHAPHEGERRCIISVDKAKGSISIHAPHEGERQRKSAFICSISANLLNIIHCGTVTRAVSRRRIALFRLFSVRRSGVLMYAYASH